jgi:hypothetical protein
MVEAEEQREQERKAASQGKGQKAKRHEDAAEEMDEKARKGSNRNEKDSKA